MTKLWLPKIFVSALLIFAAANTLAGSWQFNVNIGGFNNVHIYTPDSRSAIGDGRALLLVLHGCAQPIDNFRTAQLETAAESYGVVMAVPDAANKAGFACWSYWQGSISRNSADYKNLIDLATALSDSTTYDIDPNQVYISGLSSGATFANTTACLAPDVFAGVGVSAGPSIGTSASGAIGVFESAPVRDRCVSYASEFAPYLDTQIASIAQGENDNIVNTLYNRQNANGMALVYGVEELPDEQLISESNNRTARETLWENGRVSLLWFDSLGHAWSGGEGASGAYIESTSINYASYLARFFRDNNQRVSQNALPEITELSAEESDSSLVVSGSAVDPDGTIDSLNISVEGSVTDFQETYSISVDGTGRFFLTTEALENDLYLIYAFATDNEAANGPTVSLSQRIGPVPPASPPALSNTRAEVSGSCASISGSVSDIDMNLRDVTVTFANGSVNATISGSEYVAQACSLEDGINTADIVATDTTELQDAEQISFSITAGETGDYLFHINAGHISWGVGYAVCYLEYGVNEFTMFEKAVGANCRWEDEDGSCVGPVSTCASPPPATPTPTPTPNEECVDVTIQNYYHKIAGRAYSTGNVLSPNYFANGSNDAMAGSTWGINTLHSVDTTTWFLGSCP